ncbi:MAG: hypothetical protein H6708_10460 [Kofleriaceae bacterium]|nr:hypothetical protein [Kofleriaceae bacterium]
MIAFVHQRRGDPAAERDALAADLRLVERLGSDADVPGLRARLAGALVGLGKYAAAWAETAAAIAAEDARLAAVGGAGPTRIHGFAAREAGLGPPRRGPPRRRGRPRRRRDGGVRRGRRSVRRGAVRRHQVEIALARAEAATDAVARAAALAEVDRARAAAAPVFARLGALPEAAALALDAAAARALRGDPDGAAAAILARVVPALVEAGLGDAPLARRARDLAARLSPATVAADRVARAAALPALAARVLAEDEP